MGCDSDFCLSLFSVLVGKHDIMSVCWNVDWVQQVKSLVSYLVDSKVDLQNRKLSLAQWVYFKWFISKNAEFVSLLITFYSEIGHPYILAGCNCA